ncbi:MAG: OmpA family protein [Succinatimonas sp.]|nr:OmpA family protein [Succinatimonas sp.]
MQNKKFWRIASLILGCSFIFADAQAAVRFEATLGAEARKLWSDEGSKIRCRLNYDIPGYGYVSFTALAGREIKTSMGVHPKLGITANSLMRFIASRPEWQSGGRERQLGKIKLYSGYDAYAGPTLSFKVMNALNQGKQIFMPYTDKTVASGQNIVPVLSPLGFKEHYEKFISCQQQLLRVSFNDVQLLPLVFAFQSDKLTSKSERSLKEQLEYLQQDKSINHIVIRTFSYDMNSKDDCISMAKKRADAVKKYYVDAGFKDDDIELKQFNALTVQSFVEGQEADKDPTARNGLVQLNRDESDPRSLRDLDLPDVGAED